MIRPFLSFIYKKFSGKGFSKYPGVSVLIAKVRDYFRRKVPEFAIVDGQKIYLDPADYLDLSIRENYKTKERAAMGKYLKKGDVFVDVGAFIGYLSLVAAKIVGKEGFVYAFEPDPRIFPVLERNLRENGYGGSSMAVNEAVSDREGEAKIYFSRNPGSFGESRLYDPKDSRAGSAQTKTTTLDSFLSSHPQYPRHIDFIKLHVDGWEYQSLLGMAKTIGNSEKLVILLNFDPRMIRGAGIDPRAVLDFLERGGFRLEMLSGDRVAGGSILCLKGFPS